MTLSIRPVIAVVALNALVLSAQAGALVNPNATAHSSLLIEDGGYSWSIDMTPLLSINPATGAVSLNTNPSSPTTVTGTDAGAWSVNTVGGVQTLQWHSWTQASGALGNASSDTTTDPWRSVVTFEKLGGNLDPQMTYGFSVKNNTASTQTYTITYGEDMDTAIVGDYVLHADIGGSVSNNTTTTPGLSLQPVSGLIQSVWLGNGGVATVNGGVDVGPGFTTTSANTSNYGTFAANASGTGSYDYWEFRSRFTLSGGRDQASLSGFAEITPVPEANGLMLVASGLLALAGLKRSKRRD